MRRKNCNKFDPKAGHKSSLQHAAKKEIVTYIIELNGGFSSCSHPNDYARKPTPDFDDDHGDLPEV